MKWDIPNIKALTDLWSAARVPKRASRGGVEAPSAALIALLSEIVVRLRLGGASIIIIILYRINKVHYIVKSPMP
jgi:hypothetical protein